MELRGRLAWVGSKYCVGGLGREEHWSSRAWKGTGRALRAVRASSPLHWLELASAPRDAQLAARPRLLTRPQHNMSGERNGDMDGRVEPDFAQVCMRALILGPR